MKPKHFGGLRAACGLLVLLGTHALANRSSDLVWTDVDADLASRAAAHRALPAAYRVLRLDAAALDRQLNSAPTEQISAVKDSSAILQLPLADGRFERFRIVESPIMDPALASRYPQLRAWLGQGIDDPSATVRLDLSPKGFHAQVISWQGTTLVDALTPGDLQHVLVYHKRDAQRAGERPVCLVTGEEIPADLPDFSKRGRPAKLGGVHELRTHRLAMAATGEYTQFHGGTVIDGLAAIHTTMNRVNGIYERELSVRMVLVADNDQIIYTDGGTDPYTNSSGTAMLGQNQTNLNNVIGSANYDIGHVVSTGGGGVASLGSVCSASNKARGVTGLGSPIGDVFDVDFVAHEMGHQYRGNHAFNGSGGNCSGGNRNASTAFEPGSGITIQSYAGICGADDLQRNSEDYFHRVSLDEMIDFVTTGNGSNCGTTQPTGNSPPAVTAPAAFTIPQLTPFELVASATDGDGDTLSYIWEQFDLGAANTAGMLVDNGSRPLFRNFTPEAANSRVFPSLRYILNNANDVPASAPLPGTSSPSFFTGELLPSTNRSLTFRATARDNRAGGGAVGDATTELTVTTLAGPFLVTAPNGPADWPAGSTQTVSWNVAGTDAAPVSTSEVQISLSLDGGLSWPVELAAATANDGSEDVLIPANTPSSAQARVRVRAVGNVYFDLSDANLTISGSNTPPSITVNSSVTTQQGSPGTSTAVASISDLQDVAADLLVDVLGAPDELQASVSNSNGTVMLNIAAACTLVAPTSGVKVYPLQLLVTDTEGAVATAGLVVNVGRNATPTIGQYSAVNLLPGGSVQVSPGAPPADANDNLDGVSVSPTTLPDGGSVSVDAAGMVSIQAGSSSPAGTITVTVSDSCGAVEQRRILISTADELFEDGFE